MEVDIIGFSLGSLVSLTIDSELGLLYQAWILTYWAGCTIKKLLIIHDIKVPALQQSDYLTILSTVAVCRHHSCVG